MQVEPCVSFSYILQFSHVSCALVPLFLLAAATVLPETAMAGPSPNQTNQTSGGRSGGPENGDGGTATQQEVEDVKARQKMP